MRFCKKNISHMAFGALLGLLIVTTASRANPTDVAKPKSFPFTGVILKHLLTSAPGRKNEPVRFRYNFLLNGNVVGARTITAGYANPQGGAPGNLSYACSPTGRQIACNYFYPDQIVPGFENADDHPQDLVLLDARTGAATPLLTRTLIGLFVWSPSGRHLLIVEKEPSTRVDAVRLLVADARTAKVTPVAKAVKSARWSLDGGSVVFQAPERLASGAYVPVDKRTRLIDYVATVRASGGVGVARVAKAREIARLLGTAYAPALAVSTWGNRQGDSRFHYSPNDEIVLSPNGKRACVLNNYTFDERYAGSLWRRDGVQQLFLSKKGVFHTLRGEQLRVPEFRFWAKDGVHIYGFATQKEFYDTLVSYNIDTKQEQRMSLPPDLFTPSTGFTELKPNDLRRLIASLGTD